MNIKKKIFIPMIMPTAVCCIAVLVFSALLFNRELNGSMNNKTAVALNVVEQEIEYLKEKAYLAAYAMSTHLDLIESLETGDVEKTADNAIMLKALSSIDYCVITDKNGNVLTRTHEPDNFGDNVSSLPHVKAALSGKVE